MRSFLSLIICLYLALWSPVAFAQSTTFGNANLTISAYKYLNITTDATTTVKASPGILHTICINTPAATETLTIYDNTSASGTKIGTTTLFASTNPCFTYDAYFATGLTIVTATAAGDITVTYQ
jgi:hypothetical protein